MRRLITLILTFVFVLSMGCIAGYADGKMIEITTTYDFNEDGADSLFMETMAADLFELSQGTPDSNVVLVDIEGNIVAQSTGYIDIRSIDEYTGKYSFSFDAKVDGTENVSFFVRSIFPGVHTEINPKNGGGDNIFNYYEWDWYNENGGKNGQSTTGGSGIMVTPKKDVMRIGIKVYREDGLHVSTEFVDISNPADFSYDNFFNIKFIDDFAKEPTISIYLNNTLIATVHASGEAVYRDEIDSYSYFPTAVIKDAEGNELKTVNDTRICYESSQLAIGCRNKNAQFDNISITVEELEPTPSPVPTPTPEAKPTNKPTEKIEATPANTDLADEEDESSNTGLIIAIAIAALLVAGAVVVVIVVKKKKK